MALDCCEPQAGRRVLLTGLLVLTSVAALSAAPEPVRELARTGQTVTLGNSHFRINIEPPGTLRDGRVGDTRLISFIGLYTSPVSPELGKDVRGCQAETPGLGDRPSEMSVTYAAGAARVVISRVCSHPQVLNNEPLWRLDETVDVAPEGVINIGYHCRFDRLLRWGGFALATALTMDAVRGRSLQSFLPNFTLPGVVPDQLPGRDDATGVMGARVDSTAGPIRLWFGGTNRVEILNWTQYLTCYFSPTFLPHSGMTVYRGASGRLTLEIHLPVSD